MSPYLYRKDIIAEKDERLVNKVFTLKNAPFLCCSKCSADRMEDCSMETSRKCKIGCNSRFHCLPSCRADQCSIVLVSQNRWNQQQLAGCVLINHFVVEEHGMVLNVAPGLDEVVVVLAARVAGLAGRMYGERGCRIGQVDNLPVRSYGDHCLWISRRGSAQVDCIDVASDGIWTAIKDPVERFEQAQHVGVGHFVDFAVGPARGIIAQLLL